MIQRYNHTNEGMTPCATGYWYRAEDVENYLPKATQPLSIKLLFGWVILFTIASGLTLWFFNNRLDNFKKDLIRADISKAYCKEQSPWN